MRILYVASAIPVPGSHGGSVHALELARALSRAGHEVHLASLPPDDPADAAVDLEGVILHPLRTRPWIEQLDMFYWREVRKLAGQIGPDVILERFYTFGGRGLITAAQLGLPAVAEFNSPATRYPGLRDRLDALTLINPVERWRRWQLRQAQRYYGASKQLAPEDLRDRMKVIQCGVDTRAFQPGDPAPDAGALRCIHVSSFRSWHGTDDLVRAFAAALQAGADLELVCLGDGPGLKAARRLADRLHLGDRARFLGAIPHTRVPAEMARAHVGLAPFNPAGFSALQLGFFWSPIKIWEYAAAGLAVVTSDIPELRARVPEAASWFHQPGAVDELAGMLVRLDRERATVRAMGEAGRRVAEERYTWDRQAVKLVGILHEAIAEGRG